ncbi:MAG: fatty acid desaturase [Pseudomonadota bacterium]
MNEKNEWYRCKIDRKTLKALSRRSDRDGYIRFGGILATLIALGVLLVLVWGTWVAVPVFLVYSVVWSFANAMGHEACHGTTFRTWSYNNALLYICSWMVNWEPISVRWVHARHHSHTSIVGDDAEYALPNPIKWRDLIVMLSGWIEVWHYNKELVQLSVGYIPHFIRLSVPAQELPGVIRNARLFLLSYGLIIAAAIVFQSWLLFCLLILPRIVGEPMHGYLRILQHGGLATGVRDHRKTTRTMYVNPVLAFFYCNMQYHLEHHMFPMVPFHSLAALHEELKDQMPTPDANSLVAMRDVFAAKREQRDNPAFVLAR